MPHLTPFHWLLVGGATLWLCALIGSLWAARKGQSRGEWFLLGYLFGPVGLLLLARQPGKERRRGTGADRAAVGDMVGPAMETSRCGRVTAPRLEDAGLEKARTRVWADEPNEGGRGPTASDTS
jgi:hypothetical protein